MLDTPFRLGLLDKRVPGPIREGFEFADALGAFSDEREVLTSLQAAKFLVGSQESDWRRDTTKIKLRERIDRLDSFYIYIHVLRHHEWRTSGGNVGPVVVPRHPLGSSVNAAEPGTHEAP
jgi:hypothetical protein